MLVQLVKLVDLDLRQQATWGMLDNKPFSASEDERMADTTSPVKRCCQTNLNTRKRRLKSIIMRHRN